MTDQQPISPRRRMQELLAIPQGQRTDAEWDELNELEIALAPVNRDTAPEPGVRRSAPQGERARTGERPRGGDRPRSGDRPDRPKPSGDAQAKKPARKFHKRPPPKDQMP
jgi:hypothetical protein